MAFQVPLHTVTDCKKLKSLTILGARTIDDDSLQSLTCLTCLTALRIKEQHSCRAPHLRGSGLKYLALLAQLQHLALGCPELNPAHLVLLEACPCLQSLDLTECSSAAFHGLGLQAIATHGSRLTSLKLPFAYTNSDAAAVAGLVQQLPCLQRFISSSAIPLSQHLADALGGLKHHCKALDLQYAGLAKAGVNLSPLVQLQGLQEAVLTQAGGELLEDEGVADEWTEVEKAGGKFAAPFTSVRACAESLMALTLEAENVTATGLHYVADTAPAVPVASGMSGLSQTASALVQQAVAKWTQLQHLSLSQRLLSDEDMHVLCSLRHLHSFSLSGAAGVRGSGFAAWPNNLSRLSHVNICECGITDVGVAHVAGLPRLHSLSLQYCGQVGDAAMHVLAERAGREDGPLRMLRLERMAGLSQKGFLALGRMQVRVCQCDRFHLLTSSYPIPCSSSAQAIEHAALHTVSQHLTLTRLAPMSFAYAGTPAGAQPAGLQCH